MSSATPRDLIERLLENTLDDEGRGKLLRMLRSNPQWIHELSLHLGISEAISRLKPERHDDNFVRSTTGHILSLGSEAHSAFVNGVTRRIARRKRSMRVAAVAAVVILAGAGAFLIRRSPGNQEVIATMTQVDSRGGTLATTRLAAGFAHAPEQGLFRINFSNGAVVAIEGPADFRIDSAFRMRLNSGRLNAWCPESAHGFQVVTATGTVTDLGTSFGVSATRNGGSDFLVLDGLIEVSRGNEIRRLDEGKAVRTDHSPGFKELAFEPEPFRRTWPLASGILSTNGGVRPAPPGTAEQLSRLEDDESVLVIPERRNIPFDRTISAELVEPGTFSAANATQLHTLPADPGKNLRGFLVRYNPKFSNDFKRFEGEVTFDRPVAAICCQGKYLDATDPLFANGSYADSGESARRYRGVDLDQPKMFPDEVSLSDDRHTVRIVFSAGVSTDDIRVILSED